MTSGRLVKVLVTGAEERATGSEEAALEMPCGVERLAGPSGAVSREHGRQLPPHGWSCWQWGGLWI